jgi:hypothetical protein
LSPSTREDLVVTLLVVMSRTPAVVLLVAVTVACSDGDAAVDADHAAFCERWRTAVSTAKDESEIDQVLADAPEEVDDRAPEAVLDWIEINCRATARGAVARRVAPPVDAALDDLELCLSIPLGLTPSETAGMVLYGDADAEDPYDGPMVGLLWDRADVTNHAGDGDPVPVTVRGHEGVAAPITVFQQAIVPELGTVIAWTEGARAFGLYGKGWPLDRAPELVEIANGLRGASGDFRIGAEALPQDYAEVFSGDPSIASILIPPAPLYSVRYQGDEISSLSVSGHQMTGAEFEAFRFLTIDIDQTEIAGRDVLAGNAWSDDGPAVVTWREPDGFVVRIVGLGVPLSVAEEVAEQSRDLDDAEWSALVEADDRCAR